MIFGCHVSISGGVEFAPQRADEVGAECFQIFTQNQRQWKSVVFNDQQKSAFRKEREKFGYQDRAVVSHASYLINLCASEPEKLQRSRQALFEELQRCDALGVDYLVIHPGAHGGNGEEWGIRTIAESLQILGEREWHVRLLLETIAGQGSGVGYRLEQLAQIIELAPKENKPGVCADTCHLLAAGYDIATEEGWQTTLQIMEETIGVDNVAVWHLNDSMHPLGSRRDRHAAIGEGHIGLEGFRRLVNDTRLKDKAGILEIPGGSVKYAENIALLKEMRRG